MSAVSGTGLMLNAMIAVAAMAIAADIDPLRERLIVWIGAAFVAPVVCGLATRRKALRNQLLLIGDRGRRFLFCLAPVLAVGGVMTLALWRTPEIVLLPGLWTMLYGCGVLAAGAYAVAPIVQMGACFVVLGLFIHAVPAEASNMLLGLSFGGLNFYYGFQVYRHHGG
jgi:hypothetical protein